MGTLLVLQHPGDTYAALTPSTSAGIPKIWSLCRQTVLGWGKNTQWGWLGNMMCSVR